jgi:hypothetical protein
MNEVPCTITIPAYGVLYITKRAVSNYYESAPAGWTKRRLTHRVDVNRIAQELCGRSRHDVVLPVAVLRMGCTHWGVVAYLQPTQVCSEPIHARVVYLRLLAAPLRCTCSGGPSGHSVSSFQDFNLHRQGLGSTLFRRGTQVGSRILRLTLPRRSLLPINTLPRCNSPMAGQRCESSYPERINNLASRSPHTGDPSLPTPLLALPCKDCLSTTTMEFTCIIHPITPVAGTAGVLHC